MTAFLDSALKVISAPFASYWAIVLPNPVILTCQGIVSKRMHLSADVRLVYSLLGALSSCFVPALLSICMTEANLNVCFLVVLVSAAMVTN